MSRWTSNRRPSMPSSEVTTSITDVRRTPGVSGRSIGALQNLAEVAQSPYSWEDHDMAAICRLPPSPSIVASVDHSFLELCGESHLRNPLRGNLHGGICEGGERRGGHGRPKRHEAGNCGYSQGKTYSPPGSPLLGEMSGLRGQGTRSSGRRRTVLLCAREFRYALLQHVKRDEVMPPSV